MGRSATETRQGSAIARMVDRVLARLDGTYWAARARWFPHLERVDGLARGIARRLGGSRIAVDRDRPLVVVYGSPRDDHDIVIESPGSLAAFGDLASRTLVVRRADRGAPDVVLEANALGFVTIADLVDTQDDEAAEFVRRNATGLRT